MPYRLATPQYSNYYDILANFTHFIKRFCSHFRKIFVNSLITYLRFLPTVRIPLSCSKLLLVFKKTIIGSCSYSKLKAFLSYSLIRRPLYIAAEPPFPPHADNTTYPAIFYFKGSAEHRSALISLYLFPPFTSVPPLSIVRNRNTGSFPLSNSQQPKQVCFSSPIQTSAHDYF